MPDSLVELARALPDALRLGTSSWSFPGWVGLVYARPASEAALARHGLPAYARHPLLRTVGLDRTFYAPIVEDEFRRYAAQVPGRFRFLVKAPMRFTAARVGDPRTGWAENPSFLDADETTELFVAPAVRGLGEALGVLVFQFPPLGREHVARPQRFAERLESFLRALPPGPVYAVELRDRELITLEYAAALRAAGARHCIGIHPRMPLASTQVRVARAVGPGPLVARWNLHAGFRYDEAKARYAPFDRLVDPDVQTRDALAAAAVETIAAGHAAWIVANNKAEGSAPLTIVELAHAIARFDGRVGRAIVRSTEA